MSKNIYQTADGFISLWIEQDSSIQIKAVTNNNDPVELNETEARLLANKLLEFANKIE